MNIVFISQIASPGLLVFRKDLIKYLISHGHNVYAFATDYTASTKQAVSDLGAIPIEYNMARSSLNPFRDFATTIELYRLFKSIKPDVVFSFFIKPSIYGTLAAGLARVPRRIAMLEGLGFIHTPTKNGFPLKKRALQWIHGALSSIAYAFADEVLFLNHDDPVDLEKKAIIGKDKMKVLGPIGLDLTYYPYQPASFDKPPSFIFIARLLEEKGIYEYLAAARIVRKQYPHIKFVILGGLDDNPTSLSRGELDDLIKEELIIYPGHVSNVCEWLTASSVFVLPSYREGVPRSTQEAMAIGRAVITTNVPGCRETVQDGVNGFLVPPFDVNILAEKMIFFIKYPEKIRRMGDESYGIAQERFNVEKITPVLASHILGR